MSSTKLKVSILYDMWEESEPEPVPEKPSRGKGRKKKKEKHDREEIFEALGKLGHEPAYQVVDGRNPSLLAVARCEADLIFNLTESYAGDDTKDMNLAAYLDLLDCPYTGAAPMPSISLRIKPSRKRFLRFTESRPRSSRPPTEASSTTLTTCVSPDRQPTSEDGSIGIDASSVVGAQGAHEKIHYIQEEFDSPALIEEYIEGRNLRGGAREWFAEVLPLVELDLSKLPEGTPEDRRQRRQMGDGDEAYKVTKSAPARIWTRRRQNASPIRPGRLSGPEVAGLRRIDMRVTKKGEVFVIEANPNPGSPRPRSRDGIPQVRRTYTQLIGRNRGSGAGEVHGGLAGRFPLPPGEGRVRWNRRHDRDSAQRR